MTTEDGIIKLEAARRQLDCAIWLRLRDIDSLAVHTLAYAAYGILRDLCRHRRPKAMEIVDAIIDHVALAKDPTFLKQPNRDPEGMLDAHSPESVHLTVALTIWLWKQLGGKETPEMLAFSQLPDPYKPEHKASETLQYLQGREEEEATRQERLQRIVNSPST